MGNGWLCCVIFQLLLPGLPIGVRIPVCLPFTGRIFHRMVEAYDAGDMAAAYKEQVGKSSNPHGVAESCTCRHDCCSSYFILRKISKSFKTS